MSTEIGINKTGGMTSPRLTTSMEKYARQVPPSSEGDEQAIADVRLAYSESGEPIGRVPPPATVKGAVKTLMRALGGENVAVLMDRMGQRLAFERTGVRLYDALIAKWDAYGSFDGGPQRTQLEEIRDEELGHFHLMRDAMLKLGGDPTAVTPAADVAATVSHGIPQVLNDPRTTLLECLDAILVAELADNAGWALLEELVRGLGQDELADRFAEALATEERHAELVRGWLLAGVTHKAGAKTAPRRTSSPARKATARPAARPATRTTATRATAKKTTAKKKLVKQAATPTSRKTTGRATPVRGKKKGAARRR